MKTLTLYTLSSTRCGGYWEDEKLDFGNGRETEVAHGFCSEAAAKKFLEKEVMRLRSEPYFFKNVRLEELPGSELLLSYLFENPSSKMWQRVQTKFRISKKTFKAVEEAEASAARLH